MEDGLAETPREPLLREIGGHPLCPAYDACFLLSFMVENMILIPCLSSNYGSGVKCSWFQVNYLLKMRVDVSLLKGERSVTWVI